MIDLETGSLRIVPGGPWIGPEVTARQFARLQVAAEAWGTPTYRTYRFDAIDDEGNCFTCHASFERQGDSEKRLVELTLHNLKLPVIGLDETLDQARTWHDNWMRRALGTTPKIDREWGCIVSTFEVKTPSAFVSVRYRQRNRDQST